MLGLIGKKIGMTVVYEGGRQLACTLVSAGPCEVVQLKEKARDGYDAVQLGYGEKKEKRAARALKGHCAKAGVGPKHRLVEFKGFASRYKGDLKLGQSLSVSDIFEEQEYIDVRARAKGRGFQGVVKRHNFAGVGERTHGQHNRERAPGAIGACSYPGRVFKGTRMAGRMGGDRVCILNLRVLRIVPKDNLLVLKGSVPGAVNDYVVLAK